MPSAKSVVISCAGIGSRLGLGSTKALIPIRGTSLIGWQMQLFREVEDVRIVVGFQANEVIDEVLKFRRDVTFVFNHNYFDTKTGASFYLGARDANQYVIEYDGDLLVHPDDVKMLLNTDGEYICYADKMSDEAVWVRTNALGDVCSFSRESGDYEWTGPACIQKSKLQYTRIGNVFNQLEGWLPMRGIKVRACDIDTYDDYQRALKFIESWEHFN